MDEKNISMQKRFVSGCARIWSEYIQFPCLLDETIKQCICKTKQYTCTGTPSNYQYIVHRFDNCTVRRKGQKKNLWDERSTNITSSNVKTFFLNLSSDKKNF